MNEKEYRKAMKEAKAEFNAWLKEAKRERAAVKKASNKIRLSNLEKRKIGK